MKHLENPVSIVFCIMMMGLAYWCGVQDKKDERVYQNKQKYIRAIVGEAADQGIEGMRAVASALRNRDSFDGVYGLYSNHIDEQPQWVWDMANQAWNDSAKFDYVQGADSWANPKVCSMENYGPMVFIKRVNDHYFYRRIVSAK